MIKRYFDTLIQEGWGSYFSDPPDLSDKNPDL